MRKECSEGGESRARFDNFFQVFGKRRLTEGNVKYFGVI